MDVERSDPVTVPCHECGSKLAADSPDLLLELIDDDEPIVYCSMCWQMEFGREAVSSCSLLGRGVGQAGAAGGSWTEQALETVIAMCRRLRATSSRLRTLMA